ncbi:MAG: carboxypeptidase regulatory-like domain-containing protein [Gemmatimonas sp.]
MRLRRVLGALALSMVATAANAQATVSGHVTLQESGRKPTNDIGTAIVWLAPVGFVDNRPDTIPRQAAIAMRTREFLPHVSIVAAGGSVQFPNDDPFSHNVFSNSELGRFDLGLYPRRKTRSATVTKPGVYAVYCNIHSKMSSFIIAVPTRHVAQVNKNGTFALRDVPPGVYELHAWHERAAETATRISVVLGESMVDVSLDARGFVPGPHLNKFGQVYPVTRADRY